HASHEDRRDGRISNWFAEDHVPFGEVQTQIFLGEREVSNAVAAFRIQLGLRDLVGEIGCGAGMQKTRCERQDDSARATLTHQPSVAGAAAMSRTLTHWNRIGANLSVNPGCRVPSVSGC